MVPIPEVDDIVCVITQNHQRLIQKCRARVTKTCDPSAPLFMIGVVMELGGEVVPETVTYSPPDLGESPTWHWPADSFDRPCLRSATVNNDDPRSGSFLRRHHDQSSEGGIPCPGKRVRSRS